jgi:hypothetical protein
LHLSTTVPVAIYEHNHKWGVQNSKELISVHLSTPVPVAACEHEH